MLNRTLHQTIIISVLKAIYSDPELRTLLGFKGGTAAFLFYDLPRFSVDLDFELLDESKREEILQKMTEILSQMGDLTEAREKLFTIFFLLNYQKGERNLKIEISKRTTSAEFEVKQLLGIPILVMKQEDMVAGKLAALLTRKQFASRDLFDLYYFLKDHWQIREKTLLAKTGLSVKNAIRDAITKIGKVPPGQILRGLGELVDEKRKSWVREKLKDEVLFQLKLYSKTHA